MLNKILIAFVLLIIILMLNNVVLPNNKKEELLTYQDFDELYRVSTYENNWDGYADKPGKAVIYGFMKKKISVPSGSDSLNVIIRICSNRWGEGLSVDINSWTNNSGIQIIVEEEIKDEKIPKFSSDDIHYHHHSYYKYEFGQSFSNKFNVSGKDSITFLIKMIDDARLDFQEAYLIYYKSKQKLTGVCYGPFRDNENPDCGILPTKDEIRTDIFFISNLSNAIRTYGIADTLMEIPIICEEVGIDCYPGAWLSRYKCPNEKEIESLINVASKNLKRIKGLIVGSEVLLRKDISEQKLIEYIERVKNRTHLEVSTAEIWGTWLKYPELAQRVDFIVVHIHPYWEGININQAANYVIDKFNEIKSLYPSKPVIIGETGWPTQGNQIGEAIPSEENQLKFISDFLTLIQANNISYFYFEVFDEKWKDKFEGSVGSHWGLFNSNGSIKSLLSSVIPDEAQKGIYRPPRTIEVTNAILPLYIYRDGCSSENSFAPSGWMGELETIMENVTSGDTADFNQNETIDELYNDLPHTGNTCIRINYSPSFDKWGGIYWQYPINNWGDYPGYCISDEIIISGEKISITFWARGENGGEKAEFKAGGIFSLEKPFHDSFGPISTGVLTLNKEWQKYTINLDKQDLSMVIGGFCWVTNWYQNQNGCTIYLDDIKFEREIYFKYISNIGGRIDISSMPSLSELGLDSLFIEIPSGGLTDSINLQISVPKDIPADKTALQAVEFYINGQTGQYNFQKPVSIGVPYPDTVTNETDLTIGEWDNDNEYWCYIELRNSIIIDTASNVVSAQVNHFSIYGVLYENQVVPVELSSFIYSILSERTIELHWCTYSETNNFGFEIERSIDGKNFDKIGFVKGHGTSDISHNYNYIDSEINSIEHFYRLKQIDFDGSYEYSNAIKVIIGFPKEFYLSQNYPNPFNPETTIKYQLPISSKVMLQIFNIIGQKIKTLVNEEEQAGYYEIKWDGTNDFGIKVSSGIYFYQIRAGNNFIQIKKMLFLH